MTTGVRVRGLLGLVGAGVLLVGLTACASSGSAGSGGATSSSAAPSPTAASGSATASPGGRAAGELDGASFVATEVTGTHTIAPGSTIALAFEGGSLSANAGCNSMAGRYVAVGGKLTAPQLASTMMACDEALMTQDAWLAAFLASGPTYTLEGDTLTLTNGTDTVVLGPAPSGAQVLESTGWKVTDIVSITNQANTTTAVDPTLTAWMRFQADEVAFNNSCNLGGGPVEIGADTLTFGALRSTLIFCDGPSGQLEQTMSAVLQGETTYTITSGGGLKFLRIMSTDGTAGLGLTADDTVGLDAFPTESASATVTSGG
ncbi:MAG TPA: META domain-containing protein [Nakamurella sp.]